MESEAAAATAPADDPFAQQTDGADDPFAGGDEQPPVVNREGERVEVEDPDVGGQVGAVTPPAPAVPTPEATPVPVPAVEPAAPQEPPAPPAPPAAGDDEPDEGDSGAQEGAGGPEKAKSPMRQYHLLYRTGEKEWTEAEWTEKDESGKDKPQRVVQARNNDHALRLAFGILGSPEHGVEVLPIPVSGFKPKRLKPKAVVPRTALDIS